MLGLWRVGTILVLLRPHSFYLIESVNILETFFQFSRLLEKLMDVIDVEPRLGSEIVAPGFSLRPAPIQSNLESAVLEGVCRIRNAAIEKSEEAAPATL